MFKSVVLTLALIGHQAWAAKSVTIKDFNPKSLVAGTTNQIRAEFSDKMIQLSANPEANIFTIACSPQVQGRAQWVDEKTWTFDFSTKLYANKLPGGTRCEVTLKQDFKSAKNVTGKTSYSFQIDGPNVVAIYPGDTNGRSKAQVNEDQVFALGLDADVDAASVLKNAYFKVEGVASSVQIRILTEAEKRSIMKSEGFPDYMFNKELPLLMVQPVQKFPANKTVTLVWGKNIKSSQSGLTRLSDLSLHYATRPMLSAQFSCVRENAKADCSPFSPMELSFTSEVPADLARQVRLVGADGKVIQAQLAPDEKGSSTVVRVTFPATVKEKQSWRLEIPAGIRDDAGRPLANQASFPITVKTSEFPPLAKFAAEFGIIEANQKPVVLPATLRNLEARVAGQNLVPQTLNGASARISADNFPAVIEWLKVLDSKSSDSRGFDGRDKSIFDHNKNLKPVPFNVPLADQGKAFEVVGIPLNGPGFYVVELQSRLLGRALLGKDANMFVSAGALVTNMMVHSKFGRESSLFWVTALDSGRPVAGAQVVIHDCSGKALVSGSTDANGVYKYAGSLKAKLTTSACDGSTISSRYNSGFFVSAQKSGDFTFTHSGWNDGIEAWRFGSILAESPMWSDGKVLAHSVLDRTLLRAGETVSMKHFMRLPSGQGFRAMRPEELPNQVEIVHLDTDTRYTAKVEWDQAATAISAFEIPKEAKLGLYSVNLQRKDGAEVKASFDTASFQVMEFKVPLMKGEIAFPAQIQKLVQPGRLDAQVSVKYQDGGPASNEQVKFRYTVNRNDGLWFVEHFQYLRFGLEKVIEKQTRQSDGEEVNEKTVEIPLRLNAQGAAVVSVPGLSGLDSPKLVTTQLEFTDKNSETQNVARTVNVYPSNRLVAVDVESSGGSNRKIKFRAAVANLQGEPVVGVQPDFELFEEVRYTHKTRMVGGFYSSETFTDIKRKAAAFKCAGATDRKGIANCEVVAPESGSFIVQASVADAQGHRSYGNDSAYVRGVNRAWFPSENNDRMDLIVEKKDLQAGDNAELQVQMPFSEATALITVEREGIVEHFVRPISTQDPRVQIKIKDEYAPNVYVSVLAVRGRVSGQGHQATATVDLGKPSYKLGLAALNVNWKKNALGVSIKPSKETVKPGEMVTAEVIVLDGQKAPVANAEFALAVVDEGLLQLARNRTWDLLKAMMGERALEVETATAQMQVVGKRHFGLKAKPTGGDGGQAPTRELFDTLVSWQPRVKTDANGKAVVQFKMNDSLSKFRIVAIAHSGLGRFGSGEASVITQQEISVSPALGQISREGDNLATEFSIRNATKTAKSVTIRGRAVVVYGDGRPNETRDLGQKSVELAALEGKGISLNPVNIPTGASSVRYEIDVLENGQPIDSIRITQAVKPAVLVRTWMAQMNRVTDKNTVVGVNLPQNALPNQGGVKVSLIPSLAGGLDTVKDTLANYPFESLELDISRAIALSSRALWEKAMAKLPSHLDAEGFVMYYPSASTAQGSDVLTAYVLSLAQYAGFEVPQAAREKMISALTGFVEGRAKISRRNETPADIYIRRVNAIEVLARYGQAKGVWMTSLPAIAPDQVPTATLVDLLSIYSRLADAPERQTQMEKAQSSIRNRLTRTGTGLGLAGFETPWYMMSSTQGDQLQLILVLSSMQQLVTQWNNEIPQLVRGAIGAMANGSWNLTTANAIGILALKAYAKVYEPTNVTGETEVALNQVRQTFSWTQSQKGGALDFGWPSTGDHRVDLVHKGTGAPWSIVAVNAAIPVRTKVEKHIEVTKTVSPQQAVYRKGDVVTVTLKVKPQRDMSFVSLMDPIPAGAKILGLGESNAWPDHQQAAYDAYRASYTWVDGTGFELTYKVQLNNAGTFKLPATRVEAIYMPENFAEVPNADWTVQP